MFTKYDGSEFPTALEKLTFHYSSHMHACASQFDLYAETSNRQLRSSFGSGEYFKGFLPCMGLEVTLVNRMEPHEQTFVPTVPGG